MPPPVEQSRKAFVIGAALVALASMVLFSALGQTRAFRFLENGTYDARVRWSANTAKADSRIVVIDIDDASFNGLKDKLGRWPWTRRVWTEVLRYAAKGQPRVVAFDAMFGGVESDKIDADFAQLIRDSGNVVLGYSLPPNETESDDAAAGAATWALLQSEAASAGVKTIGERLPSDKVAANVPLALLAQSAAGLGATDATFDSDGTARRIPLAFIVGNSAYRGFARRVADLAAARANAPLDRQGRVAEAPGVGLPVDSDGRMLLEWHGDALHAYQRIPIWQVIASIYPQQFPEKKVYFAPEFFRGKIVIIGPSARGSADVHPTPFSDADPGFFVHATAIDNLLHGVAMAATPAWFTYLAIALMSLAGAWLLARLNSVTAGMGAVLAVAAIYIIVCLVAFSARHLWMPIILPVFALVTSAVGTGAVHFVTTGRELRRTRGTLDRYISPALVKYVLGNLDSINLAGEKRELTIFFSDIRSFTTLTESSEATEVVALLNEYLAAMVEVIFKYDGIVDKFIGDGILAWWGAFTPGKNHALLASQAALEMLERLKELNAKFVAEGRKTIAIGIGLNTGQVVFGNVGSGKKIEFTVIGDPVNLAARLEGENKGFKTSIIISDQTREHIAEYAIVRPLGEVKVKGKTVETRIFELRGIDLTGKTAGIVELDPPQVEVPATESH